MNIVMEESQSTGARWVCPNDRHLALRAKLRTGWSVKTGYLDSGWSNYSGTDGANRTGQSFILTEEERRTIIQVIQRAEALDLSEQKRIGRLVERLEDMKRNVRIITSTRSEERKNCGSRCSGGTRCVCSCALCGEKFGAVLGASPTFCKDCRKYVCQKCGREAGTANSSTLIGEPLSTTSALSSSSSASAIVKNSSANESQPKRTAIQRIVQRTSNNSQKLFLCRICAESREIWKKSGAWFFKGMPKHDPPKKKERDWSRTGQRMLGQPSCRIISVCKSLETSEGQDSSSEDETARRSTGGRRDSTSSPSFQVNQDNGFSAQIIYHGALSSSGSSLITTTTTTTTTTSTITTTMTTFTTTTSTAMTMTTTTTAAMTVADKATTTTTTTMTTTTTTTTTTENITKDKSTLSIHSQCNRLSPSISTTPSSRTFRTNEKSSFENNTSNGAIEIRGENMEEKSNDFLDDSRGSVVRCKGSQVQSIRRNSITNSTANTPMVRIREEAWIHERGMERETNRVLNQRNDAPLSTWYVHHSDPSKEETSDRLERLATRYETEEEDFGTLEVSLLYDPVAQCLQCKVERALGLKPMDIHDLADPFCKINILPVGTGTNIKVVRTKTVHKTRDPVFNETVNFYVSREADMKSGRALHIMILQDDPSGEDFLGEARFPLCELEPFQTKHYKVTLQNHYPVNREEEVWGLHRGNRGQIQLTLSYCTRRRVLLVTIHQAMNLLPMDKNGFSDPFVKLCLVENVIDNRRQRGGHDTSGRTNAVTAAAGAVAATTTTTTKKHSTRKLIAGRSSYNTSIKWKTLNPEWNEEFVFGIRLADLTKVTLCLSMWDKDFGKSNDYLGGLALGCNSKGARLRHWIDVIKFPDYRHPAWHNLTETVTSTD